MNHYFNKYLKTLNKNLANEADSKYMTKFLS